MATTPSGPLPKPTSQKKVQAAADPGTRWFWLADAAQRHQTTAMFRRRLESTGGGVEARISASHLYRLYVNGEAVGRGPARSDPRWPYYDTYDLTPRLRQGSNIIVVLVHHFDWRMLEATGAKHRAFCLYSGPPGLWCDLRVEDSERSLEADSAWQGRLAPGWADTPERIGRFLGYQHHVDLAAFAPALAAASAGTADNAWSPVAASAAPGLGEPEPLPCPSLRSRVHEPIHISTLRARESTIRGVGGVQLGVPSEVISVSAGEEGWITFDYGRPMAGFPVLTFDAEAPAEVTVYMGEAAQSRPSDVLQLPAGSSSFQPLDWRGGQRITLRVRALGGEVRVPAAHFVEMAYPFTRAGDFACSSEPLTRTWQLCADTAAAAMIDHPVDCLGREQALWIADLHPHARAVHAAFGDWRPIEKAIRQAIRVTHDDGVVAVPGPVGIDYRRTAASLPWSEQSLTLALTLRDHHQCTGRTDLVADALPKLVALYQTFERYRDHRGLLATSREGQPSLMAFGGWNPMLKRGVPTALNFEYARSLDAASDLAEAMGKAELAAGWRGAAIGVRDAARAAFWDDGRKLYIDGEHDGRRLAHASPTANAWAALAGGIPPGERGSWAEAIRGDTGVMPPVTPYDASLLMEAFLELGLDLHARELLDRYFGSLARSGVPTLPEAWLSGDASGAKFMDDSSACHPYGASPAWLLHRFVLGVKPLEPGYRRLSVAPRLLGLYEARGRVPTPHGAVCVEWRREDTAMRLRVELPAGVDADVCLARLGWVHEELLVNGESLWTSRAESDYAKQRRHAGETGPREARCELVGGSAYHVELRTR